MLNWLKRWSARREEARMERDRTERLKREAKRLQLDLIENVLKSLDKGKGKDTLLN